MALALTATFAAWEYSARAQTRDLLSGAMCGEEDLLAAFKDHERSTAKDRFGNRFGALAGAVLALGLAVDEVHNGGWVGVAVAILLIGIAWILARQVLSAKHRRREDSLDSGKVSWADYLLWAARGIDEESSQSPASLSRYLWFARARLVFIHALLVLLAVERGGVWIVGAAVVIVFHIHVFRMKSRLKRLGKGE